MEKNAYGTDFTSFPYDPPPSYESSTSSSSGGLTFIDFLPMYEGQKSLFSSPNYGTFKQVVSRANKWLQDNSQWEVKTCESLTVKLNGSALLSNDTMRWEPSETTTIFVRGIRMWIFKNTDRKKYSQIEYLDVLPQVVKTPLIGLPEYESSDVVVAKINNLIRSNRITGRIISVETLKVKILGSLLDTETCYWSESGTMMVQFAYALRTFYFASEDCAEEIEFADFAPSLLNEWGLFSTPQFESFSSVVANASRWGNGGYRILNVQSVPISMTRGAPVDTKKMSFSQSPDLATYYLRVVRVAYFKNYSSGYSGVQLACRTFTPAQLSSGFRPTYESVQQTKERINAWIRATEARVVNVETREIRMYSSFTPDGPDSAFTYTKPKSSQSWQTVFRVYMDGMPLEPPPHLLPPVPAIADHKCLLM